jgi:hypothetical protein
LVLALLSGCIPVKASVRNNEGDGSACIKWGRISDLPVGDAYLGDTDTDPLPPL